MEKVAELPPLALITFGVTIAIIFAVRYLGLMEKPSQPPANAATVAAVIVDPSALMKATAAVDRLTDVLDKGNAEAKDHAHMICRRVESLDEQIEELVRAMGEMRVEMARRR